MNENTIILNRDLDSTLIESTVMDATDTPQAFIISSYKGCKDTLPKERTLSWQEFCRGFGKHAVRNRKDGAAWSPATILPGQTRENLSVKEVSMAVIDIDDGTPYGEIAKKLDGLAFLAHSSYSHTESKNKYRVIIPLAKPVPANEWPVVWTRVNLFVDERNDPSTKDASRLYYTPAHPVGADCAFVQEGKGRFLSIDDLPALPEGMQKLASTTYKQISIAKLPEIEGIESSGPDLNFEQGLKHVVSRCAFMKIASAPENQKTIPEPLWMAMISNACRFENSEAWIHVASEHHPGYDEAETAGRIERYRNGPPPITCQRIRELGFENCPSGGCARPNGIAAKSPAALGTWMFHRQLSATETGSVQLEEQYTVAGNFVVNQSGVFETSEKNGEPQITKLCSRIDVTALTRDADSSNWGTELSFRDPDGVKKTWALPMELLASAAGESYRASLYKMGAVIEPSKTAREGLAAYLAAARPGARALSVRQPGWSSTGVFVLPDATYGESTERLVFQTTDPNDMKRYSRSGTLESWQQQVATPCTGNSRAVMAICIGLAPPLLSLLGEDNGGFHLRGNSSSGKTVCLGIGASVWGGAHLIRTWNMTTNGIEGIAAMHNDVLLPLDELGQADGKAAGETAYMLGNGQGKGRANREGDARAVKRFRNLVLSSGEKSLADLMMQAGQSVMAGQEVRMVEISADAGCGYGVFENIHGARTSQAFAESLKQALTQHHGHAGRAFVTALADPALQPRLIEVVQAGIQRFVDAHIPSGATGQVGRVGRRFGLVAAAGELAIDLGILPWPSGEAIAAAGKCFAEWIDQRGGTGNQEEAKALAQVRRFIELHGESRFTAWNTHIDNNGDGKTINRAGFRRVVEDGRTEYFILPEVYKSDICSGLNPKFVTEILVKKRYLAVNKQGDAQIEKSLPGMNKKRVYHLTAEFMEDGLSLPENDEKVVSIKRTSEMTMKYKV
jgi:uncharacterized protein (DUF927 family)